MLNRFCIILFLLILTVSSANCQETDHYFGYQTILIDNPAFSGSEGDGTVRLQYHNYFPGNSYNLHSVNFSYDSYYPAIHGGAGVYLSDDFMGGIINDLRGGLSYSYFLQAGKDIFINAGLSASFFRRGFSFENAILPDQINPLGGTGVPSSETLTATGHTVFDVGAGFLFIAPKFFGGFSVSHLAEPDISLAGITDSRLKRKWLFSATGDFLLSSEMNLKLRPVVITSIQGGFMNAGTGTILESKFLSVNAILLGDSGKNLNIQTGFSINTGRICIYYNYRFNIVSSDNMMPLSLLHQTGIAFSLNNVDKRKTIKTINFPKM